MSTPVKEIDEPKLQQESVQGPSRHHEDIDPEDTTDTPPNPAYLQVDTDGMVTDKPVLSPSRPSAHARRLDDELAVLEVERQVSNSEKNQEGQLAASSSVHRSRSRRSEPVDEFDVATNPLHEQTAAYKPPENPTTSLARLVKKVHESSFLVRYFTYIMPLVLIFLIPLLVGALAFPNAHVGGVKLLWFSVWLEIFWLTLWAGRIVAKCIPLVMAALSSVFTNNVKKHRDLGKQLELPAALFFWWLGVEISFLPTMTNHHIDGNTATKSWEVTMNKIIISIFVGVTLNLIEKVIIQLIAISFHLRTYADRIELNKFQIGSLTKLYAYSKEKITMEDYEFEETAKDSGNRTPMQYAVQAGRVARGALNKMGDVAGVVAGDFTGRKVIRSNHPHQVVLTLLGTTAGGQVLARRLYRTFARDEFETVFSGDLKAAFDNGDEAEAAFAMFDKDMNGDISMEELEAVCVEIGRERKSITASLKDLDSVVSKLDSVFIFIVSVITLFVFLSLISASTAGVLASAGSSLLALSWLFSATAQEFLQSLIFVFVKHPFDVGDRVTIYGNTGASLTGDDYYVKKISLLYTEFKKMEGHVVQAPNSYLNSLFILNQRRSGALAEAVPIIIRFGTTLEQIDDLRVKLLDFVREEKREYQGKILTELRQVTENLSITLNVVFFYKSNWQNELLRLQRRNKFICKLMVTIQEVGIEGPFMNAIGARNQLPYHVNYQGAPPTYSAQDPSNQPPTDPALAAESRDGVGELGTSTGIQQYPSILRNRAGTTSSTRSRTGSASKHVDFSLGMRDVSASDDNMSDVFEDRTKTQFHDIMRAVNRETAERRAQEQRDRDEARLASLESERTGASQKPGGTLFAKSRSSVSSSLQRGRFLSRLGGGGGGSGRSREVSTPRSNRYIEVDDEGNLMEQGRYQSPGTGYPEPAFVGPHQEQQTDSVRQVHGEYGSVPLDQSSRAQGRLSQETTPEEYEMGRYRAGG
ncbi:hypothetical protein AJ80_07747 [Polytolypa hystricis UAMH7299]|uniref:Mechanosensitive ion channel protein n=1 Tax=Polytolypa hystricis (strain UAMH7299) TaxID=1447883 RepID=A0A2B7XIW5_POLH7|nr:hypothetical protein AJ80_07747 [Polytolypa hystricis UAMH7299]